MHPGHGHNAVATWQDFFTSRGHTGQTWACIAVAIAHADHLVGHVARGRDDRRSGDRRIAIAGLVLCYAGIAVWAAAGVAALGISVMRGTAGYL